MLGHIFGFRHAAVVNHNDFVPGVGGTQCARNREKYYHGQKISHEFAR
jgi:hypothetical protein